jgi:hypothetical protein
MESFTKLEKLWLSKKRIDERRYSLARGFSEKQAFFIDIFNYYLLVWVNAA